MDLIGILENLGHVFHDPNFLVFPYLGKALEGLYSFIPFPIFLPFLKLVVSSRRDILEIV